MPLVTGAESILHFDTLSLAMVSDKIHAGVLTPVDLVERCLHQIEQYNEVLNAFLYVAADQARLEAQRAADAISRGEDWGTLHGIPLGIKDLINVGGQPTTAGSIFFKNHIASKDAPVITRLKAAGAIILGKTNLHEFALGSTNFNPHYGPVRNPWHFDLSPGGSSGGSAAAVASGLCPGALGTDTGGSVRMPTALCGLTGLRPAMGAISTQGVFPMSDTLDTVGPMAHTARDVAMLLDAMVNATSATYLAQLDRPITGLRVGLPAGDFFWQDTDSEIVKLVRSAGDLLTDQGLTLKEVLIPGIEDAIYAGGIISLVDAALVHQDRLAANPDWFGADVRARLERGLSRSGVKYAYAMQIMRRWQADLAALFREQIDVLLTPITPIISHTITHDEDISAGKDLLRFTYPISLSGLPALSVPCGFSAEGLPVGMQLIGPRADVLLRVAAGYQAHTNWHKRRPPLRPVK